MNDFKSAAKLATPSKPVNQNWFNTSGHELAKSAIAKKQYEGQLRSQNIGIVDEPYLKEGSHQADVGFFRESADMSSSTRSLPTTPKQPTQQPMPMRTDTHPGGGGVRMYQQGYLPAGYIPDADPKMVQRRAEAGQVHQDRLANIASMQADRQQLPRGQFASMGQESAQGRARANMYSGRGGGQLPRGNADFQRRHAGEQYARETARMNAQTGEARMRQLGQLGQAELASGTQQAQLGRESAERIAGAKGLQQASEAQRKSKLEQQKLSGNVKHQAGTITSDSNYKIFVDKIENAATTEDRKLWEDKFLNSYGMGYGTHQSIIGSKEDKF